MVMQIKTSEQTNKSFQNVIGNKPKQTKNKKKQKETKNNKYHTDKIITSPIISTRSHVRFILFYFIFHKKQKNKKITKSNLITFAIKYN